MTPEPWLRDRLTEPSTWMDPPAGLLDRIVAEIDEERAELARPRPAGAQERVGGPRTASRPQRIRRAVVIASTAALIGAAAATGFLVASRPAGTQVQLTGTRLAAGASATATMRSTPSGLAVTLDVSGLEPSAPGFYYQAWMKGPPGLVAIGTFHLHGGTDSVDLWSAVDLADYPTITITREPEDGNPASSGLVVLTNRP